MISKENGSVNILSKVDRSLVATPAGPVIRKVSRYDWTTGGSVGIFAWINKNSLNIDGRYQREQVSEAKIRDIASKWDWLLLGALSVIVREDESYWVFDGGHRVRAAFYRDDVECLPCMVHTINSVNEEAKAFVARNTMVSNVSAFDRFHASVCAKDPVAVDAHKLMQEFGIVAIKGGMSSGKFLSCVGALQKCVEVNLEDARKVFGFCIKLAGDSIVTGRVLTAMFTLHQHFKPDFDVIDKYGEKISRHSQREIEIKMGQFATECGKNGNVICAKAILDLINHRNRNRIAW